MHMCSVSQTHVALVQRGDPRVQSESGALRVRLVRGRVRIRARRASRVSARVGVGVGARFGVGIRVRVRITALGFRTELGLGIGLGLGSGAHRARCGAPFGAVAEEELGSVREQRLQGRSDVVQGLGALGVRVTEEQTLRRP